MLIVKKENKYSSFILIQGGSLHTMTENAEALIAATRENGLEESVDKLIIGFFSSSEWRTNSESEDL